LPASNVMARGVLLLPAAQQKSCGWCAHELCCDGPPISKEWSPARHWTLEPVNPMNPMTVHWVSCRTSIKSSIQCKMHAKYWLSIMMSSESTSKGPRQGPGAALSCVDNVTKVRACGCLCLVMSGLIHDFMISNHWLMASPRVVLALSPRTGCPEP